jgi:hypothetical protein
MSWRTALRSWLPGIHARDTHDEEKGSGKPKKPLGLGKTAENPSLSASQTLGKLPFSGPIRHGWTPPSLKIAARSMPTASSMPLGWRCDGRSGPRTTVRVDGAPSLAGSGLLRGCPEIPLIAVSLSRRSSRPRRQSARSQGVAPRCIQPHRATRDARVRYRLGRSRARSQGTD